jgi:hypothetical protein
MDKIPHWKASLDQRSDNQYIWWAIFSSLFRANKENYKLKPNVTVKDREGHVKIRVKCTLVQALRFCTGRTAHRGSRGIALLFHDHGTRRGWGVSFTPRPLFTPGKDPVPIVQEAGWAPGTVWTCAENLASTGIRSPDRPARSQSLYRLNYPAHRMTRADV